MPSEIRTGHPTKASQKHCSSVSTACISLWLLRPAGRYIHNCLTSRTRHINQDLATGRHCFQSLTQCHVLPKACNNEYVYAELNQQIHSVNGRPQIIYIILKLLCVPKFKRLLLGVQQSLTTWMQHCIHESTLMNTQYTLMYEL